MTSSLMTKSRDFAKNYFKIIPVKHFILINDSGLFYFTVGRNGQSLRIQSLLKEFSSFEECRENFANQLKIGKFAVDQPFTCLIGGSKCFYYTRLVANKKANPPSELTSRNRLTNVSIRFKYIKAGNRKWLYYSGLDEKFLASILKWLARDGILVTGIQPLTLFLLEILIDHNQCQPAKFILPGETVWFKTNRGLDFYESCHNDAVSNRPDPDFLSNREKERCYSLFNDIEEERPEGIIPLKDLFRSSFLDTGRNRSFFGVIKNKRTLDLFSSASNALKLAAFLAGSVAIVTLILAVIFKFAASGFSGDLDEFQNLYMEKQTLQAHIETLENKLEDSRSFGGRVTSLAGAFSAFCQRRPGRLYLTEINAFQDEKKDWVVVASGMTEKENSVFNYRSYTLENIPGVSIDVTLLQESKTGRSNRNQPEKPQYSFKMKMSLE